MTDTADTITANEIAVIGKETDDDGDLVFSYRKRTRQINRKQMDRFDWLTMVHEEQLSDLLDQYSSLIVHWHDDDARATVYCIPGFGIDDLKTQPRYLYGSVEVRFPLD